MKTITQKIFDEILIQKFPGKFELLWGIEPNVIRDKIGREAYPEVNINDAFWLADIVGLFRDSYCLYKNQDYWVIGETPYKHPGITNHNIPGIQKVIAFKASLPEVICQAIYNIYKKK